MTRSLNRLTLLLGAGFLAVALAAGFWQVLRAGDLLQRGDNPRRALLERRVPRGQILDRNGLVLADSAGAPGAWVRHYPYPNLAPVLGYVSPLVGSAGIEAALDPVLHGDAGLDPFTIYWRTSVLGTPPPGRGVRLTIDLAVQQVSDTALGAHTGAVLLLDAQTGDIVALASHPTFDANDLDGHWSDVVGNPASPLLNRATLALYQPGGALAPVIIAGAFQNGLARDAGAFAADSPAVTLNGQPLACRVTQPTGPIPLQDALTLGCPGPLAALGSQLGAARLAQVFNQFQLFQAPALSLPTIAPSLVPAGAITDTALASLGQGSLTVSPLQMALVAAAIARHGQMPAPRLILQTQSPSGGWVSAALSPTVPILAGPDADAVIALMPNGLQATAITNSGGQSLAWYLGFAPSDEPKYVVVVLLEAGDPRAAKDIGDAVLQAAH
jgi:penicillin-binding protein A